MIDPDEICATCRFWFRSAPAVSTQALAFGHGPIDQGTCQAAPPTFIGMTTNAAFPMTHETRSCSWWAAIHSDEPDDGSMNITTLAADINRLKHEIARLEACMRASRKSEGQLIQIGNDARISRDMVASLEWRRPTYANSAGTATLLITLKDGRVFKVEHRPNGWGGADAYAIERELIDAD